MAKVGRNDPCPCGSGKKHKHCCLAGDEAVELAWHRVRRAEGALVPALLSVAWERYGRDFVDTAWAEFRCWDDDGSAPTEQPEFDTIFVPWLVFDWVPDHEDPATPADWPKTPLGLVYRDEESGCLDDLQRRFLETVCRRPYSFYAVTATTPGRSVALEDVLTGSRHTVLERNASRTLREGEMLFTRVLPLDGIAIMVGGAPLLIPPTHRLRLLDLRDQIVGGGEGCTEDDLRDWDVAIREMYHAIAGELRHPRLPELRNTDGDPLVPTTLRFDLRCAPAEALERLRPLALDLPDEELLADAERDDAGHLRAVRFDWLVRGNAVHAAWDNTVRGQIRIDGPRLVVDVNSARRAETIRGEIETRLADAVVFRAAATESLEQALAERRSRPKTKKEARERIETERLNALPEVQAYLREMGARHWEGWLDDPLPALRGLTPRQAAGTPEGRERLEALLVEFEWQARRGVPASGMEPDVAALRARLGM